MTLFESKLEERLQSLGIDHDGRVLKNCEAYYRRVVAANARQNLTRIVDEEQAAQQHFADAMALCRAMALPRGCRVIDVGTGAGFPGVPIKLLRGDINLTLLDASQKKTAFIRSALDALNVDARVICGRAEELAALRGCFDAAVTRAVAPLPVLLELAVPLLETGGVLAAWKGETFESELTAAASAMRVLGCAATGRFPVGRGAILLIQKQKTTPDVYPRRFSKIKSAPL